jgi:hypothetical protein
VLTTLPSANNTAQYIPAILGQVLLAMGDWEAAAAELERALDLAEAREDLHALELIHSALAELVQVGLNSFAVRRSRACPDRST